MLKPSPPAVSWARPMDAQTQEAFRDINALEARALDGDREAWGELIARYNGLIQSALRGRGVSADRARELAQETWARLMAQQRRGVLRELRLPMLALAQAAFLAMHDARAQRLREESNVIPLDLKDPAPSIESRLVSRQLLARAQTALAKLSPRQRDIFIRTHSDPDTAHAEVAQAVGLSVQRVRQILWEVRSAMRKALGGGDE